MQLNVPQTKKSGFVKHKTGIVTSLPGPGPVAMTSN
jgi:hypothetical protein